MRIQDFIGETTEYDKKRELEIKKPKSWCKSVSAFANGTGGYLIFGIDDNDQVVGLANAENDAEKISEIIKERLNPIPNFELRFESSEDGQILILLQVFSGDLTPYYYSADGVLIAYVRVGNQSAPASAAKHKELVLKGSGNSYDSLPSKYSFDNMSFTKLKSTYWTRTGVAFEASDYASFGLVDEHDCLTNAGALLADDAPIRYSRLFCTRWNGLDKAPGAVDALDDKEFSGSLVALLQDGVDFVAKNSKQAWKKTGDSRIEMADYPQRAVLEGIVNALIHRNYLEIGSEVHIDIFDNRLEIYSPGGMCDGTRVQERNIMQVPSRRRNPIIADIFHRLKYMDRRGSGFKKILTDYQSHPKFIENMMPEFISDNDSFILIIYNLNYKPGQVKQTSVKQTSVKQTSVKQTSDKRRARTKIHEEKIRTILNKNPSISCIELSKSLQLSPDRTRIILHGMDDVTWNDSKRNRIYSLKQTSVKTNKR